MISSCWTGAVGIVESTAHRARLGQGDELDLVDAVVLDLDVDVVAPEKVPGRVPNRW